LEGGINLFTYTGNNPVMDVDPLGLWTSAGHEALTRNAMGRGFSQGDIALAVRANVSTDYLFPIPVVQDPYHYMPGSGDDAERLVAYYFDRAVVLNAMGLREAAMNALGIGLHILQDRYSHYEPECGWSIDHTKKCDDPIKRPCEYGLAKEASQSYIDRFLARSGAR
jgi:hypothetical protein